MCTLAVYHRVFPQMPLVVAANRDEFLARPAAPPGLLPVDGTHVVGGRDLEAGGTWLGVTETGLIAALLNRRTTAAPLESARSRGQLCLDALGSGTAAAAAARAAGEPPGRYNPYNLLVADPTDAFVATQPPRSPARLVVLQAGLHLVTNLDVDDPMCPRIARSRARFEAVGDAFIRDVDPEAFVARLQEVLADHTTALDPRGDDGLCVHRGPYGTRSASVIIVGDAGDRRAIEYFHADGPPCRTRLERVALPF